MSGFAFPKPGERANASAIPVPEEELIAHIVVAEQNILAAIDRGDSLETVRAFMDMGEWVFDQLDRAGQRRAEMAVFDATVEPWFGPL